MTSMRYSSLALCLLLLAGLGFAGDWTQWRGPSSDGVSPEKGLPQTFKVTEAGKNNLVWKAPYGCRSTPIVLDGRVYFNTHTGVEKAEEQESVVCLDAKTGKKLWQYK